MGIKKIKKQIKPSLGISRPMPTQLLSTWRFGKTAPPHPAALPLVPSIMWFVLECLWSPWMSCPSSVHPAPGESSQEAEIWRLGRAVQQKLKHWNSFCHCCFAHKSRTQHQMGCSEPAPPEPDPAQTSAHPGADTNLSSSKVPHLKAFLTPLLYSPHRDLV